MSPSPATASLRPSAGASSCASELHAAAAPLITAGKATAATASTEVPEAASPSWGPEIARTAIVRPPVASPVASAAANRSSSRASGTVSARPSRHMPAVPPTGEPSACSEKRVPAAPSSVDAPSSIGAPSPAAAPFSVGAPTPVAASGAPPTELASASPRASASASSSVTSARRVPSNLPAASQAKSHASQCASHMSSASSTPIRLAEQEPHDRDAR
eukprot:scaffold12862_cov116-Isochrysis_galbana.AAC.6